MKYSIDKFDSLGAFIEAAQETSFSRRRASNDTDSHTVKFSGSDNLNHAIEIATHGINLDKIEANINAIQSTDSYEMKQRFDVSGGEVEMGLYMTGVPECMIEFELIEENKYINVLISLCESHRVKAPAIQRRAAAICSIVQQLEQANYRVKLTLAIGNGQMDEFNPVGNVILIDIKHYQDNLPLSRLAGVLHSSFFRRIVFMYWEGHEDWRKPDGYGNVMYKRAILKALRETDNLIEEECLFLPAITEKTGADGSWTGEHGFTNNQYAKDYADYITDHIEELTIRR